MEIFTQKKKNITDDENRWLSVLKIQNLQAYTCPQNSPFYFLFIFLFFTYISKPYSTHVRGNNWSSIHI